MRVLVGVLRLLFISCLVQGCATLPNNQELALPEDTKSSPVNTEWIDRAIDRLRPTLLKTKATMDVKAYDPGQGSAKPFVGVALSGGGSRAANFSAAVLLQLKALDFLDHVSSISSVSGGSLPGAYFSLFGHDENLWNEENVRRLMRIDFEDELLTKFLAPYNWFRFAFTEFNRTDALAEILDENLFKGAQFKDLKRSLLVNATTDDFRVRRFTFTDEALWRMASRLDNFPIARAVATSAAFPGIFRTTSLRNFAARDLGNQPETSYLHLFDGGVRDNLGMDALIELYRGMYAEDLKNKVEPRRCLIFLADAQASGNFITELIDVPSRVSRLDGILIDSNMMRASDNLFRRAQALFAHATGVDEPSRNPLTWFYTRPKEAAGICMVWHISVERLATLSMRLSGQQKAEESWLYRQWPVIDQIPTRFALIGPDKSMDAKALQNVIFDGVRDLMREDPERPLLSVCHWFLAEGIKPRLCGDILSGRSILPAIGYEHKMHRLPQAGGQIRPYIGDRRIRLAAPGWYRASFVDASRIYDEVLVHEPSGASIRFADLSVKPGKPLRTRIRMPFFLSRETGDDERARGILAQLINKFLAHGVSEVDEEFQFLHPALDGAEEGMAHSLLLQPPLQDLSFKQLKIGTRSFQTTELWTQSTGPDRARLRTGIYVGTPRPADAEGDTWKFLFAAYHVPVGAPYGTVAEVRSMIKRALSEEQAH